jgi:hypothetical protein
MQTVSIGDNTADDFQGCEDAQIRSGNPTFNYGGGTTGSTTNVGGIQRHTLIRFSGLSNISGPVSVSSASINMEAGAQSGTVDIRRLLRDWVEGTQTGADRQNDTPDSCCYDEYGNGISWTTAGGLSDGNDRVGAVSAQIVADGVGEYKQSGDVSPDVEDQINGDVNNDGFHLDMLSVGGNVVWEMSESGDGRRPFLDVTYTAVTPSEVDIFLPVFNKAIHSLIFGGQVIN